jgi:hypothetical protein
MQGKEFSRVRSAQNADFKPPQFCAAAGNELPEYMKACKVAIHVQIKQRTAIKLCHTMKYATLT